MVLPDSVQVVMVTRINSEVYCIYKSPAAEELCYSIFIQARRPRVTPAPTPLPLLSLVEID